MRRGRSTTAPSPVLAWRWWNGTKVEGKPQFAEKVGAMLYPMKLVRVREADMNELTFAVQLSHAVKRASEATCATCHRNSTLMADIGHEDKVIGEHFGDSCLQCHTVNP